MVVGIITCTIQAKTLVNELYCVTVKVTTSTFSSVSLLFIYLFPILINISRNIIVTLLFANDDSHELMRKASIMKLV